MTVDSNEDKRVLLTPIEAKLYFKMVTHILGFCSALFELVTSKKSPKPTDVLAHKMPIERDKLNH